MNVWERRGEIRWILLLSSGERVKSPTQQCSTRRTKKLPLMRQIRGGQSPRVIGNLKCLWRVMVPGGLTLAILLKKSNVPFLVLERARAFKPLGKLSCDGMSTRRSLSICCSLLCFLISKTCSVLVLGISIAPLFLQLGIYEESKRIGKHDTEVQTCTTSISTQSSLCLYLN